LKRKRPNFMRGEPPSWMRGWHRQNHASGGGKVHNHLRTHGSEGATVPGRIGPGPVGPAQFRRRFGPPFLAPEGSSTLKPWRHRQSTGGEPFTPGGHRQARERGGRSPEGGSTTSMEAPTRGEEGRHRRKGNHDQRCYV
jgi:hypothetical protein